MEIAGRLPTHFDVNAMEQMPKDLRQHDLYVAEDDDGTVVGYLTLLRKSPDVGEISWMGVIPGKQRNGIGTALVERTGQDLVADGASIMMVHTLADTVEYEPYEATRAFYLSVGFKHLETIDPYPRVAPGNPIAIYIKVI